MNYFRYLFLAATMFAVSGLPVNAMEPAAPRSSFFGRCYGYASSWISSSFLVTREFVKREFRQVLPELDSFNKKLNEVDRTAAQVQGNISAIKENQELYHSAFNTFTLKHDNDLEKHKKNLNEQKENSEKLAASISTVSLAAKETDRIVTNAYAELEKLRKNNSEQRDTLQVQTLQLSEEQKRIAQEAHALFDLHKNHLSQTMALIETNSRRMAQFGSDLNCAVVDAKKRSSEQKKNSDQLLVLRKQAEEQERKMLALAAAFNGFKNTFYASILSKPASQVGKLPMSMSFGKQHNQVQALHSPRSKATGKSCIEDIQANID